MGLSSQDGDNVPYKLALVPGELWGYLCACSSSSGREGGILREMQHDLSYAVQMADFQTFTIFYKTNSNGFEWLKPDR